MTKLPADYDERVYAGWLGKCIGVRLGAPVEGWTYEEIRNNIGQITGYLHEPAGKVFKPDDDTALPMILIRALEDYGATSELSARQVGETWLNYLGDQHGTLWWGGYGISSEHTAYLNLAAGIPAPRSGSIEQNGAILAEQIGGQIFSDIWGLVAPLRPELAAQLSERAASVSHDGEGLHGARYIAALVSLAFGERDPRRLVEAGLAFVPPQSAYARVVRAMLDFHTAEPDDWRAAFAHLQAHFGYDRYAGMVPIVPNAGVVVLALLYGAGDFSRAVRIATMAGWDTDCNVGNVGAIMGVACGVEGIGERWRAPINDLLIAASVVGANNLLTVPQCADLFARLGRQLAGEEAPAVRPRRHFAYSGATSNFQARAERGTVVGLGQRADVAGEPVLAVAFRKLHKKGHLHIYTRTYYRVDELSSNYYGAEFSPLVYPGQRVSARLYVPESAPPTVHAGLYVYDDAQGQVHQTTLQPVTAGAWHTLHFEVPPLREACLSEVGVVVRNMGEARWETGAIYLAALDWGGTPHYTLDFSHARTEGQTVSQWTRWRGYWRVEPDGVLHGSGADVCESYTGAPDWEDYTLRVKLTPLAGWHHHVHVRVQGARRSYAFGLAPDGAAVLYKKRGAYREVARVPFPWQHGRTYTLTLSAQGDTLRAEVKGESEARTVEWRDEEAPYLRGQVGLSTWIGHTAFQRVALMPVGAEEV